MTNETQTTLCPDDKLTSLVSALSGDQAAAMSELEAMLSAHPGDPRLHFLHGSLLAAARDYGAARDAMRRAVDLAPDFGVARFQLGFLLLTSGEPHAAQEAWGPLHGLAADHYLRLFVTGLTALIQDRFQDAISTLQDGIERNTENPAMNGDMQLMIDEIRRKLASEDGQTQPPSAAQLLLQQAALKATRH